MRWFTTGTSFVVRKYVCNLTATTVWIRTPDTSAVKSKHANHYTMRLVHLRVPLSYTQICTPMRLVHLRYLFRIPKYVPLCVWFTSGTSFVYSKHVPPMRLVHLRYLFRIPKHVPLCVWFTSGTSFVYPNMYPYAFGSPQDTSFVYPNM